ncbi:MAG: toprim domain-containing protein [Solirubrobacteraceae bacterium]
MSVRTFYAALSIDLPAWSKVEAPVQCFAHPEAHNHGDRSPSCSVNLASGAWNCHGCGAHGGAYDAALAAGQSPRAAMELLVAHGLVEPSTVERGRPDWVVQGAPRTQLRRLKSGAAGPCTLAAHEDDVRLWAEMLDANGRLLRQLTLKRAWGSRVIRELELGFDGARITIPIRDRHGGLRGVLRYDPFGRRNPKMLAVTGTWLGLIPHPAREASDHIILVEGPPDMVAARSCGLPAIAIPGTSAWQPSWAGLFARTHVTIVMDCDGPGRHAADEIAKGLHAAAVPTEIIDLWPDRHDGYDLTDRILERRRTRPGPRATRTIASLLRPVVSVQHDLRADPRTAKEAAR